mgnify:CR=1 FL=1
MPRRPDLIKAVIGAGLICLWVCLLNPAWSRAGIQAPVRLDQAAHGGTTDAFPSYRLTADPPVPSKATPTRGLVCPPSSSGSTILHWISGGFLGSLLCYYVYGYSLRYIWQEVWPPGLLDFLGLAALCYLGYRFYLRLNQPQKAEPRISPAFLRLGDSAAPSLTVTEEAKLGLAAIQESDANFNLQAFGEEMRLLLVELYEAWNREDLQGLNGKVKESLLEYLQMGLKIMFLREESSYLEDLTLDSITITAAGANDGRDYITVCFHGRILDYVLDKSSGKLLLGSMAYPATFQEYWDLERPRGQSTWVLHDIRES